MQGDLPLAVHGPEEKRHAISRCHAHKFAACFCTAEGFPGAHDLGQLLQEFNLLLYEQFLITQQHRLEQVRDLRG